MSNISSGEMRLDKEAANKALLRIGVKTFAWTLVMVFATYVFIAATVGRYLVTNLGVIYAVTPTFEGNIAEEGSIVYMDLNNANKYTFSFGENLITSVKKHDNVIIAQILAGPHGAPDWEAYDELEPSEDGFLNNEYIIKCLMGCSEPNAIGIMPAESIMGSYKE